MGGHSSNVSKSSKDTHFSQLPPRSRIATSNRVMTISQHLFSSLLVGTMLVASSGAAGTVALPKSSPEQQGVSSKAILEFALRGEFLAFRRRKGLERCPEGSQSTPGSPNSTQEHPNSIPRAPQEHPTSTPRAPQETPKHPKNTPRAPKETPRASQEAPRSSQETPTSTPRAPQEAPRDPEASQEHPKST